MDYGYGMFEFNEVIKQRIEGVLVEYCVWYVVGSIMQRSWIVCNGIK